MREVYTLGARSDEDRLAWAVLLSKQFEGSKICIPTHLSAFHPTSMLPIFRRQSTLLRIAHYHALILAHRPFMLYPYPKEPAERQAVHGHHIKECIDAAMSAIHAIHAIACGRDRISFRTYSMSTKSPLLPPPPCLSSQWHISTRKPHPDANALTMQPTKRQRGSSIPPFHS